jgi:hypothetical protein
MVINGTVYEVTDLEKFQFIVTNLGLPTALDPADWVRPWPNLLVGASMQVDHGNWVHVVEQTDSAGSFSFADAHDGLLALRVRQADLTLLYRTDYMPAAEAADRSLNIYLHRHPLDSSHAVTAGAISSALHGSSLPGNTVISSSASGLSFEGSHRGAVVQFDVSVAPSDSHQLSRFLFLGLEQYEIDVDLPASLCENAQDVLHQLFSGIWRATTTANQMVLSELEDASGKPPDQAQEFFERRTSTSIMDVTWLDSHSWSIGATDDNTPVFVVDPCFGYPRNLAIEPIETAPANEPTVTTSAQDLEHQTPATVPHRLPAPG